MGQGLVTQSRNWIRQEVGHHSPVTQSDNCVRLYLSQPLSVWLGGKGLVFSEGWGGRWITSRFHCWDTVEI